MSYAIYIVNKARSPRSPFTMLLINNVYLERYPCLTQQNISRVILHDRGFI